MLVMRCKHHNRGNVEQPATLDEMVAEAVRHGMNEFDAREKILDLVPGQRLVLPETEHLFKVVIVNVRG